MIAGILCLLLALFGLRLKEQLIVDALTRQAGISSGLAIWIGIHAAVLAGCMGLVVLIARQWLKAKTTFNGTMVMLCSVAVLMQAAGLAGVIVAHDDTRATFEALTLEENAEFSMIEDGRLQIVGPIGPGFMEDFAKTQTGNTIKTIEITSEGGLLNQAMELASIVEKENISVIVRSYCFSACVPIAVSSLRSYADTDAVFGLHKSSPIVGIKSEVAKWSQQQTDQEVRDFLKQHGVPEDFLAEADKRAGEEIFEVSASDMLDRGIIEGLVDGQEVVAGQDNLVQP